MARYETRLRWTGSTGLGWEHYDREHTVSAPPAEQEVRVTTGESKGDPAVLNPEQLLVMAASSCQMLWFLHLASKARIDVVAYADEATAVMPEDEEPSGSPRSRSGRASRSRATRARSASKSSSSPPTGAAS